MVTPTKNNRTTTRQFKVYRIFNDDHIESKLNSTIHMKIIIKIECHQFEHFYSQHFFKKQEGA